MSQYLLERKSWYSRRRCPYDCSARVSLILSRIQTRVEVTKQRNIRPGLQPGSGWLALFLESSLTRVGSSHHSSSRTVTASPSNACSQKGGSCRTRGSESAEGNHWEQKNGPSDTSYWALLHPRSFSNLLRNSCCTRHIERQNSSRKVLFYCSLRFVINRWPHPTLFFGRSKTSNACCK